MSHLLMSENLAALGWKGLSIRAASCYATRNAGDGCLGGEQEGTDLLVGKVVESDGRGRHRNHRGGDLAASPSYGTTLSYPAAATDGVTSWAFGTTVPFD